MGVASAQSCSETPKGKVGILNSNELNHFQFYFYARYGHGLPKVAVLSISNVAVTLQCQSEKVQQITAMAVWCWTYDSLRVFFATEIGNFKGLG